jgi:probable HAF family extracellular repeat protein
MTELAMKSRTRILGLPAALILSLFLLPAAAEAGGLRFTIQTIPALPATNPRSQGNAINGLGQATGLSNVPGNSEAFLFEGGTTTSLGNLGLGGGFTSGSGINDAGVIVGSGSVSTGTNSFSDRAFVWQPGLGFTAVLDPEGVGLGSNANAVNNAGQVVGVYRYSGFDRQGFVYQVGDPADTYTLLPFLDGSDTTNGARQFANAINDGGVVAGAARTQAGQATRAVRWVPDGSGGYAIETLARPTSGTTFSNSFGINDLGQIVGSFTDGQSQAVLWNPDGTVELLGLPSGASGTSARDINNSGLIVGDVVAGAGNYAFLHRDGQLHDLNDLISGPSDFLRLTNALGINDRGQVVGYGVLAGGGIRGFVLTVVPEPSSVLLAVIGLGIAGVVVPGRARRRSSRPEGPLGSTTRVGSDADRPPFGLRSPGPGHTLKEPRP